MIMNPTCDTCGKEIGKTEVSLEERREGKENQLTYYCSYRCACIGAAKLSEQEL